MDVPKADDKTSSSTFTSTSCQKYFMLLVLSYATLEVGSSLTAIGTTLVDLELHFHMDLGEVSGYLLAFGLSGALGSLVVPVLIKRCNVFLLMTGAKLCHGAALLMIVATPFCSVTVVSILALGFSCALSSNGSFYICNAIFTHHAYALHCVLMNLALGTFLCPLIAEPFLAKNVTEAVNISSEVLSNTSHSQHPSEPSNCLIYFFVILAAMTLPSALAFGAVFLRGTFSQDLKESSQSQPQGYTDLYQKRSLSMLCFLCLTVLLVVTTGGLPFVHGNYLMFIAEKGRFKVSVRRAAEMTSVYWLMGFFGRFVCMIISFFIQQVVIMYISLVGTLLAFVFVSLSFHQSQEIYFWVGSLLGAFFASPGFPTTMAWCREYTPLTPVLLSVLTVSVYIGDSVLPFIAGHLIGIFGATSEGYYASGLALFQLLMFCLVHIIGTFLLD